MMSNNTPPRLRPQGSRITTQRTLNSRGLDVFYPAMVSCETKMRKESVFAVLLTEKIGSVPEESGMETPGKIFNRNE